GPAGRARDFRASQSARGGIAAGSVGYGGGRLGGGRGVRNRVALPGSRGAGDLVAMIYWAKPMSWLRSWLFSAPLIVLFTVVMGTISLIASFFDATGNSQHRLARIWAKMILAV